jgi:hypothetical protein
LQTGGNCGQKQLRAFFSGVCEPVPFMPDDAFGQHPFMTNVAERRRLG